MRETFGTLQKFKMMLNPSKCVFGVTLGKFIGFLIYENVIKANPNKVQAVISMNSPQKVKEVQRLTRCLAALGRFLSRSGDKNIIEWTDVTESAFAKLKDHLHTLPRLDSTVQGETLYMYLAISEHALSAILLTERGEIQ